MKIQVKRIYEDPSVKDGARILVDRLWPRGMSKENAKIDGWVKELAPSTELRKWYSHEPEKWEEFKLRYFAELESNSELVVEFYKNLGVSQVTFLFSSQEQKLNNAFALKEYVETKLELKGSKAFKAQ